MLLPANRVREDDGHCSLPAESAVNRGRRVHNTDQTVAKSARGEFHDDDASDLTEGWTSHMTVAPAPQRGECSGRGGTPGWAGGHRRTPTQTWWPPRLCVRGDVWAPGPAEATSRWAMAECRVGVTSISDTPSQSRDLLDVVQRYPLIHGLYGQLPCAVKWIGR